MNELAPNGDLAPPAILIQLAQQKTIFIAGRDRMGQNTQIIPN